MPLPKTNMETKKLPADAAWIWSSETRDNQTVWFRKHFDLSSKPRSASLYLTVDNFFTAYVNGKEVGATKTEPGGDEWSKVHRYDIAPELQPGENVIAVIALNESSAAGLLARLEINGKLALFSDKTWMQTESEPPSGWMLPGFQEEGWKGATREAALGDAPWGSSLTGWPVPLAAAAPYLHHLPLKPVAISPVQPVGNIDVHGWRSTNGLIVANRPAGGKTWSVIVDFGKELDGRVELSSDKPVEVQVGTGESSSESIAKPWTTAAFALDSGRPQYSAYTALRFACLVFPASVPSVRLKATLDHLYYPVEYRGSFDCSDKLLTRIWYTGAYTAHNCMQEDIWDAPKRDRARWMGDLHVSGEVINNVFLDRFLMEQTLSRLRRDSQGGVSFSDLPRDHVNGIPGYSCAWVCGLADFYRHVGDLGYVKAQHALLISMLEYFREEFDSNDLFANKRGKWPFVDWSPDFDKDTPRTRETTQMFFIKALREASFLLKVMGDSAAASKYGEWADRLIASAQAHFVDDGTFSDRRQENAMAVYSGTATGQERTAIWDKVLNLQSPSWRIMASPYYNNYVIAAMGQLGHTEDVLKFARQYWGGMLAEGATSFWEAYDTSWPKTNFHLHLNADDGTGYFVSLCHGWSAGITNFLTEQVLGVQPTSGGFKTCSIRPSLGDLQWASGTVPTPNGPIEVNIRRTGNGGFACHIHIPKGVEARLDPKSLGSTKVSMWLKPGNYSLRL
jgi:hypothetical protein